MKDPVLAIITRLKADTAVAAVVSTRVYRMALPTSPVFPAITVSRVSNIRDLVGNNTGKYAQTRIQCTAWAATDGVADSLSELIADSLNGIANTLISPGTGVIPVYFIGCDDAGTVPDSNMDVPVFMYHRDFLIDYAYA
jgi:hypothetical protein